MAKAIHKAKDNSFKVILDEPELFAQFLRDYIPVDVLNDITPEDIVDMTERYIPLFQDHRDSDIVKRVNLKGMSPLYVIAIVEHESKVNFRTSFKMLQYITLVLSEYEKEADKEASKSSENKTKRRRKVSETKGFRYPPVLPIVFYDGAGKWTAARKLADKTELGGIFEKYIPSFEYELVNLNDYKPQDIARFENALSLIMLIDKIRNADGIHELRNLPEEYFDKLKENIPAHLNKLLSDVITIFLTRINVPKEEIEDVTDHWNERRSEKMFNHIKGYDVQETRRIASAEGEAKGKAEGIAVGKAEGKAEGEAKVKIETAQKMLADGVPVEKIIKYTGLTREEIMKLGKAH